jgi:hypothetical protein
VNSRGGQVLATIVGLLLLLVAGWAIIRGVEEDPSVVGSFATALAAVVAVVYGRTRERRIELQTKHQEELLPIYQEYVYRGSGYFEGSDDPDKTKHFYEELIRQLLLRGPGPVVKAIVEWQRMGEKKGLLNRDSEGNLAVAPDAEPDVDVMLAWERVIRAIRDDLGQSSSELQDGDLLRLYIHDIDQYLHPSRD